MVRNATTAPIEIPTMAPVLSLGDVVLWVVVSGDMVLWAFLPEDMVLCVLCVLVVAEQEGVESG